jgi:hypothetical protein
MVIVTRPCAISPAENAGTRVAERFGLLSPPRGWSDRPEFAQRYPLVVRMIELEDFCVQVVNRWAPPGDS